MRLSWNWFVRVLAICILIPAASSGQSLSTSAPEPARVVPSGTDSLQPKRQAKAAAAYGNLPLSFEANIGQSNPSVRYLARGSGYRLFLTDRETVFSITQAEKPQKRMNKREAYMRFRRIQSLRHANVRMRLKGASSGVTIVPDNPMSGKSNYMIGKNPDAWHLGVPNYGQLTYKEVYPGIDMVFHGTQGKIEYDFVVAPKANPKLISIQIAGEKPLWLDPRGDLHVETPAGTMIFQKPLIYQALKDQKKHIDGAFVIRGADEVAINVGRYDRSKPLTIDPVLVYSSYLGGTTIDGANDIALDSQSNTYITGWTMSSDFPLSSALFSTPPVNTFTAFVTKFDASGQYLVYSTYLGGSVADIAGGIAVDANGSAYITGETASPDFPVTTSNCFQASLVSGATSNAFLTKISPDGQSLQYSTFLGGAGTDAANKVAVDSNQNAYLVGYDIPPAPSGFGQRDPTPGQPPPPPGFPTTPNAYQQTSTSISGGDVFVTRIDTTQAGQDSLIYSTFLGGNAPSPNPAGGVLDEVPFYDAGFAIAVDANANVYVAGATQDGNFPTTTGNAYQASVNSNGSAFLTRIDTTQAGDASLIYSTALSGSVGGDAAYAVALDSNGYTYIAGDAESPDFPVTTGVSNNTVAGKSFVAKFDTTQSQSASLLYSTLVGGSVAELADAISVDPSGRAYVGGFTVSPDFPVTPDALQSAFGTGGENSFLAVLSADASQLLYATYLGGTGSAGFDILFGIALDPSPNPNIYIAGVTASTNFQTTPTAYQAALAGPLNCFIAELSPVGVTAPVITSLSTIYDFGGTFIGISGTEVTINGTNFGNVQGSGSVKLGGVTAPVSSWSDTSIVVAVPSNAPPGFADAAVSNGLAWSNSYLFVVAPVITTLSPAAGPVGATVDISGTNLGTSGNVTFNGTSATTTGWSPTNVVAVVPTGATTGDLIVTSNSIATSFTGQSIFTVTSAPSVSGISPTSGPANTSVTITGSNFGSAQADENGNVVSNGVDATITSWSSGSIVALVPVNAAPGTGTVSVNLAGVSSAAYTFTVIPTTNLVDPSSGAVGQTVNIFGANFGWSQGSGSVQFGGTLATISAWTPTEIDVVVPSISLGATTITVNAGTINANTQSFTVTSTPTGSGGGSGGTGGFPTDADQTLPPFGGFSGSGIDATSLQNGNIHISIPLIEAGERGGRKMWYKFVYDTPVYVLKQVAVPVGDQPEYSVIPAVPRNGSTGWRVTSPLSWTTLSTSVPFVCVGASPNGIAYRTFFSAQDPDGVTHPFGVTAPGYPGTPCSIQGVTVAPALDGSGLLMDISTGGRGLVLKDGTTLKEDTNGNFYENGTCNLYPEFPLSVSCPDTLSRLLLAETLGPTITFTTPLGKTISGPQYLVLTYTDSNGTSQSFQINYQALDVNTNVCTLTVLNNCNDWTSPLVVPQSLVLPTGNSYQFTWANNSQAQLQQVQLPTGGSMNYTYAPVCMIEGTAVYPKICSMHAASRTVTTGSSIAQWTYTPSTWGSNGYPETIVTDPYGNTEEHQFTPINPGQTVETTVNNYNGSSTNGPPMKSMVTSYTWDVFQNTKVNIRPYQQTVTLDSGQTRMTQTDYDTSTATECSVNSDALECTSTPVTAMNPIAVREYDYGSATPLRTTNYTYLYANNPAYATANMLDRVATKTVLNGSGTQIAQTQYTYDNYSQTMASSGAVQHDPAYSSSYTLRGNLTGVGKWRSTDGAVLSTTYQYDDAGNVLSITDPLGNTTTMDYTDSWGNASCAPAGPGEAYPTTITNALGQPTTATYDSCTGLVASATDLNGESTAYGYDGMSRPTSVVAAAGASVTINYQDTSIPFSATQTQTITSSQTLVTTNTYDGLGRIAQTQLTSDVTTSNPPSTVFTYDLLNRKSVVYNATRCMTPKSNCGESTWGTTTYLYDPLSRIATVTEQDGSQLHYSYSGNITTITDEINNQRQLQTDGLGRVTSVWEAPNGPNYQTTYTFDALNNLTGVMQSSLPRSFVYDSLSELILACNPETGWTIASPGTCNQASGAVVYTYDGDGDVSTKTDARGITTTYSYDPLNRVISEDYSDGTPTVRYGYDGRKILGPLECSIHSVVSSGFSVGRRTAMCDGAGTETWSYYDIPNVGMQVAEQRTTDGVQETVVSQNNLAGSLAALTYPSGRTVTYTSNGAGLPIAAQDMANEITFASNGAYTPSGGLNSVSFGTSINLTTVYNSRLRPCWTYAAVGEPQPGNSACFGSVTPGNLVDLQYHFGASGNVVEITNNRVPNRSQTFAYDQLNRITTAQTTSNDAVDPVNCWSEAYAYDNPQSGTGPWGNLIQINPGGSAYTGCTQESGFSYALNPNNPNNQISGWCYDASGNLLAESPCSGLSTYYYDAENQLTATTEDTYEYDGDGRRVSKSSGTLYWYGGTSEPIAETDASGNIIYEYVFFAGKRIAREDSNGNIVYYLADQLGTSRVVSDASGTILDDSDFYPYGGERPAITPTSGNTYKFTGKERDSESEPNLDNFSARYYGSSMGRFTSPDPGWFLAADVSNPQTWNQYSYVLNNPVRFRDPTGLYCAWEDGTSDDDPADGGIDNNPVNGCEAQGGHWTNASNPCQGADNCVATFDWNQPQTLFLIPNIMSLSSLGLQFTAGCEGFRGSPYNDSAGNCTVGYGHLLHKGNCTNAETKNGAVSQQSAMATLQQDLATARAAVNNNVTVGLTQGEFDALTDFAFNVGTGNFQRSAVLEDVNSGQDSQVAGDLAQWARGGPGLAARRANEGAMYNGAGYAASCYATQ